MAAFAKFEPASLGSALGAVGQHLEPECARHRDGFHQLHVHLIAEPVGFTRALAGQRVMRFVVIEKFGAQRGDGDEPIGTRFQQPDKQPALGDA